jgi:hypothetical protein
MYPHFIVCMYNFHLFHKVMKDCITLNIVENVYKIFFIYILLNARRIIMRMRAPFYKRPY